VPAGEWEWAKLTEASTAGAVVELYTRGLAGQGARSVATGQDGDIVIGHTLTNA